MKINEIEPPNLDNKYNEFIQTLYDSGVPLPYFIPKTKKNHYFYKNGLSHIIPRLKVKVHSEVEECFELWNTFSPKESIYQLWEFRYSWYQSFPCKLYFYTLYENKTPVALLPLWLNSETNTYEFFGGWWIEDNVFFVKEEKLIDLLFEILPTPIRMESLTVMPTVLNKRIAQFFEKDYSKSFKNIDAFQTVDDYLSSLKKKPRYNLRRDVKRILALSPEVYEVSSDPESHFEKLVELNKKRFNTDSNTKSIFFDKDEVEAYKNIFRNAGNYSYKFTEVYIQNQLAAIDLILTYKNVYYTPIGANNIKQYDGIGSFMLYNNFSDAINKRYSLIDCMQIDYGWKHRYFDQVERYKIVKT